MLDLEQSAIIVRNWKYDINRYGYNIDFNVLKGLGRKNYESILKRLEQLKLPDPLKFKYTVFTLEELKDYVIEILSKVLGSSYTQDINKLNSLVIKSFFNNPFDASVERIIENDRFITKKIRISNKLYSIEVLTIAHEFIHAMLSDYMTKNFNNVISNIHYNELLSILIEYITCFELSKILQDEDLEYKHQIHRLDGDVKLALEHKETSKLSKTSLVNLSLFFREYVEYEKHNSFGYITSHIYARRLFDYYMDDGKVLISFYKSILSGVKSITDLIKYYGLSLSDNATIMPYNNMINRFVLK